MPSSVACSDLSSATLLVAAYVAFSVTVTLSGGAVSLLEVTFSASLFGSTLWLKPRALWNHDPSIH